MDTTGATTSSAIATLTQPAAPASPGLPLWWLTMAGNRARTEWLAAHHEPPALLVALTVDPMQPAEDALLRWFKANGMMPGSDQDTASAEGHTDKP